MVLMYSGRRPDIPSKTRTWRMKYEALAWGFHSPALQENHEVLLQVTHVYDFAFEFDVRVFFSPAANLRERRRSLVSRCEDRRQFLITCEAPCGLEPIHRCGSEMQCKIYCYMCIYEGCPQTNARIFFSFTIYFIKTSHVTLLPKYSAT
jgi:hypothetical protein